MRIRRTQTPLPFPADDQVVGKRASQKHALEETAAGVDAQIPLPLERRAA